MPYTIGEVARMMNIAPSTLRYYDKEGLLNLCTRDANGRREFSDRDLEVLSIIEYLKFCGLPLKEIRAFLQLLPAEDASFSAKADIFSREAESVRAQIETLQAKLDRLDFARWYYETAQRLGSLHPMRDLQREHFSDAHWNIVQQGNDLPLSHIRKTIHW